MQVEPVTYCLQNNNENKKNDTINIVVPKKTAKMLASALLSLGVIGQTDLALNSTNNNIEQVNRIIAQDNYPIAKRNARFKDKDNIPLTDEEKMHRIAMTLTLLGFFMPVLMNAFSNSADRKSVDDLVL